MSHDKSLSLSNKIEAFRDNLDKESNGIDWLREITRSSVTVIVAGVYGWVIWYLVSSGIEPPTENPKTLQDIIELGDLVNKLLLPVVTLVLGFYYGTQKS